MTKPHSHAAGAANRRILYRYLMRYKQERAGESPSMRDMSRAVGMSLSVVHHHLGMLARDGRIQLIKTPGGTTRHIAIPGERWIAPDTQEV